MEGNRKEREARGIERNAGQVSRYIKEMKGRIKRKE